MSEQKRYEREREDTAEFWTTVHAHIAALLAELGDRGDGWQVTEMELRALEWFLHLHGFTHEIDDRLKFGRLPQDCPNVPDGYVGHLGGIPFQSPL